MLGLFNKEGKFHKYIVHYKGSAFGVFTVFSTENNIRVLNGESVYFSSEEIIQNFSGEFYCVTTV